MANILYGVNGEGAGHSTRSKEVLTHLREQGHTLHIASFDRGLQNLRDQFEVTEIFGFRFAYVKSCALQAHHCQKPDNDAPGGEERKPAQEPDRDLEDRSRNY
jgi:hypothetical protein